MNLVEEMKRHGVGILLDEGSHRAELRRLSETFDYRFDDVRTIALARGMSPGEFQELLRPPVDRPRPNGQHNAPHVGGRNNSQDDRGPWLNKTFTADALQKMTFQPLTYLLPGLVPEGLCLLVSRPKLGKSWLALDIAIATAAGRLVLGELKPASGDVLYLALEDGRRRLRRRLDKLLPTGEWPKGLTMTNEWSRSDQGGLTDIEGWIKKALNDGKCPRLVIIDTLAQFRRLVKGKDVYLEDYAAISGLQKLASKYNVTIIVVHHDRKGEAEDVFDTVSGSLGLTGAADTIAIMKRQSGAVTLHVRGRDVEEAEKALQFDKAACRWTIIGEASEVRRSDERSRVLIALEEARKARPRRPRSRASPFISQCAAIATSHGEGRRSPKGPVWPLFP
jgi:AAA domain